MHHSCCYRSAHDRGNAHCAECGSPLLRCAASTECGGLVDTDGACNVCILPVVTLGGAQEARVGGAVSLPLSLRNNAQTGRPLFLVGLWIRESGGAWRQQDVAWDRLDCGKSGALPVQSSAFDRTGSHLIEIAFAVSSRWRWREEVFAYTTGLDVTVGEDAAVTVQQNISYSAEAAQPGATIFAPVNLHMDREGRRDVDARGQVLALMRASKLERSLGLRGASDGTAIPRGAKLAWKGFRNDTSPFDGPLTSADGVLTLGRSRSIAQGGNNDVRLLALSASGTIDEQASLEISREHFCLWIENDRLMLRVESERGGFIEGEHHGRGAAVSLQSGDTFSPVRGTPRGAALRVNFESNHGTCHTVQITAL